MEGTASFYKKLRDKKLTKMYVPFCPLELFAGAITDAIKDCIQYKHISTDEINSRAISILTEIQEVLQKDEGTDFDIVEKIVCIFEKYKISASPCHDFG